MNDKIYQRNVPDKDMKPYFDYRSEQSRYNIKPKNNYSNVKYNYDKSFNPGYRGEVENYFSVINKESELRNQYFYNRKYDTKTFIPDMNGDLYNNSMNYKKKYTEIDFNTTNRNFSYLAPNTFNNQTKLNIK